MPCFSTSGKIMSTLADMPTSSVYKSPPPLFNSHMLLMRCDERPCVVCYDSELSHVILVGKTKLSAASLL